MRLKGYDYTQAGAYFVTIVTQNRQCLFGEVVDGVMQLHEAGDMVLAEWNALPDRFPMVEIDTFVIMPNHIHGIITINKNDVGAGLVPAQNTGGDVRAGLVPAQNTGGDVGAGLVPAHNRATTRVALTDNDMETTRVAPTDNDMETTRVVPAVDDRATTKVAPTVGDVIGAFKSRTTVLYATGVKQLGWTPFPGRLWQRNYYEHIIRNEESLNRIRKYLLDNPMRWLMDRENPDAVEPEPVEAWRA